MYLEIDEGFLDHPKTLRLCALLENDEAPCFLMRLWRWACRCAKDGSLAGMRPAELEIVMGWRPRDGRACAAVIASGFVEADEAGCPSAIHDWMDYTGAAVARMESQAAQKKLYRMHGKRACGGVSDGCMWCMRDAKSTGHKANKRPRTVSGPSNGHPTQSSPVQPRPVQSEQTRSGSGSGARVANGTPERKTPWTPPGVAPPPRGRWMEANAWLDAFKPLHGDAYGLPGYGNGSDTSALATLQGLLDSFGDVTCASMWEEREDMIGSFLNDREPRLLQGKHAFVLFVARFNSYRRGARPREPEDKLQAPMFNPATAFPK